ncbi:hypothetical protein GCM10027265_04980 [Jatrophihabitans fulvus]
MGCTLLLLTGTLTAAAAPISHLDKRAWIALGAVSAVMVCLTALSVVIDWRPLPTPALLLFPVMVFAAFFALGMHSHGSFAPLSGFFTLCFGYAGLTQRPRRSLLLVLPSSLALVSIYGKLDSEVGIRLAVATSVWIILAEVLSGFVARQHVMEASLRAAAFSDPLTGLPNRRDLNVRLATCQPGTTLIVCDLDHFKRINDEQGHSVGDQVLADFGSAMRATLREDDYCARFGGEEFVLVLPSTTPEQGLTVLDRLRQRWHLLQPTVTFSAGIACCRDGRNATLTLAAADTALYDAKDAGRNTDRLDNGTSRRSVGSSHADNRIDPAPEPNATRQRQVS